MNLTQETIKRIEDEAEKLFPILEAWDKLTEYSRSSAMAEIYAQRKLYVMGATAEAERAAIVEAEKDKIKQERDIFFEGFKGLEEAVIKSSEKIQQLTAERDAYKSKSKLLLEALEKMGVSLFNAPKEFILTKEIEDGWKNMIDAIASYNNNNHE